MVKAKSPTGAQASEVSSPAAAEMRRVLDLIVSKAGTLKSRIEEVQCTAIDTRLTLMDHDARQDQEGIRQARKQIADELSSVVDDIETLLAELQSVSTEAERGRLQ